MGMSKVLSLLAILLLSVTACAEDPNPVVPKGEVAAGGGEAGGGGHDKVKAITYTGYVLIYNKKTKTYEVPQLNPQPCTLQLSILEEEEGEHESGDHGHHWVAQVANVKAHGQRIPAMEISPYYMDLDTDKYVEEAPASGNHVPTLVGIKLDEKAGEPDVNELENYETTSLIQSFQVEFENQVDFEDFEEAVEGVLESDGSAIDAQAKAALDQLYYLTIQQQHITHVDPVYCSNFKLDPSTSIVEFEFEGGHKH